MSKEIVVMPYAYSVSLDCTAKGYIQPSIKIQCDNLTDRNNTAIDEIAILLLDSTVKLLRKNGYKVATDIEEVSKNGKD